MKISIVDSSLSGNALHRVYGLTRVLSRHYEVEVVGLEYPGGLWSPLANEDFPYVSVRAAYGLSGALKVNQLANLATGDVVYVHRPVWPGLMAGILRKKRSGCPLVLDIDDYELDAFSHWHLLDRLRATFAHTATPDGLYLLTWLCHHFVSSADAITVQSSFLKDMFGGVLLPHGCDTTAYDPDLHDPSALRERLGLTGKKVVLFLGTFRPHKGLDDLVAAVRLISRKDVVLLLVGSTRDKAYVDHLVITGGDKLRLHGPCSLRQAPEFLALADVVAVPQRDVPFARAQVPAKLFDAMAMARPIVSTRVSDIPDILLPDCGLVVEPSSPPDLAEAISSLLDHPEQAAEMGLQARERCRALYSWDAMEKILLQVMAGLDATH